MKLGQLAEEYAEARASRGLVLYPDEVAKLAVDAARFYAGYGDIASLSGSSTKLSSAAGEGAAVPSTADDQYTGALPVRGLDAISEGTDVTMGEWAIIRPLFVLYVDKENALRIESSGTMGVQAWGRNSSEIAAEIDREHAELPNRAIIEAVIEV